MTISIVQIGLTASGYFVDGDTITIAPTGTDNSVCYVGYSRAAVATPASTISSASLGAQAFGVSEFDSFAFGSQDAYTFGLDIPNDDVPVILSALDVVHTQTMLMDAVGLIMHLKGAEQTNPFRPQTGTDRGTFSSALPTNLDYNGLEGDLVVYQIAANGSNTHNIPPGFTEQATSSTGGGAVDSLLGAGRIYTKILTEDETGVEIPHPKTANSSGWHFLKVIKAVNPDTTGTASIATVTLSTNKAQGITNKTPVLLTTISNYDAVGSVEDLPHAGTNTSGSGYDIEHDRIGFIRNGAALVIEYAASGTGSILEADPLDIVEIRTLTLSSMDGTDSEGWCYMPGGEAAAGLEDGGRFQIAVFDIPEGTSNTGIGAKQVLVLRAPNESPNLNEQVEGIIWVDSEQAWYVCIEGGVNPKQILKVLRPGVAGRRGNTTTDYSYDDLDDETGWSFDDNVSEPFNAATTLASTGDLSDIDFDPASGNLIVTSHTAAEIVQLDRFTGAIVSRKSAPGFTQIEFFSVLPNGKAVVGGEPKQFQILEANVAIDANPSVVLITLTVNNATGDIDYSIEGFPSVISITLSKSNATGEISTDLDGSASLSSISLTKLNASGLIDFDIAGDATLKTLTLTKNNASGSIGADLDGFPNVVSLTLAKNNAIGSYVIDLEGTTSIVSIALSVNPATGSIGVATGSLTITASSYPALNISISSDSAYNIETNSYPALTIQ